MDVDQHIAYIDKKWDTSIIPELQDYIKIPNQSPLFDPAWQDNGLLDKATSHIANWCQQQDIPGLHCEIVRLPKRTPVILMVVPGASDAKTVLLYGHLDKQPPMTGWDADLDPYKPVLRDGKLYGRGGADDGYAAYASLTAISTLVKQNIPFARCVVLIEACEESGSFDLPFYIDALQDTIATPDLVICLDAMCGNYNQLWLTTSLRGLVGGTLRVDILRKGIHSGYAGGIVPSSFRIIRQLLDRIEDPISGKILLPSCQCSIPADRIRQAEHVAAVLGNKLRTNYPFVAGAHCVDGPLDELLLKRTWKSALAITGVADIPALEHAGNVLRPSTQLMLSLRIPPLCDPKQVQEELSQTLQADPPYGAKVQFKPKASASGWNAPATADWLTTTLEQASQRVFAKPAVYMGEGGSIPFMGMLGEKFPDAQFMITGVLGPKSNAHGPNEFLHIATAKKLTACVALVLAAHYTHICKSH